MSDTANRVLYLAHGGGPLPLLGDPAHAGMVAALQVVAGRIGRPSAIIVASAHWEAELATVTTAAKPSLIYDYYGFPEEAYRIGYPAPGAPELAHQVAAALAGQGIAVAEDGERGFDHGLFVPLKLIYPDADIPCIQLSLLNSLDAEAHIAMGEALATLPDQNLLLIGSGFSFHNMHAFYHPEEGRAENEAFEAWVVDTCGNPAISEDERRQRLIHWAEAPGARYCHPREEHLLPLHLCYGMAGRAATEVIGLNILGRRTCLCLW